MALSWIYVLFGNAGPVAALFFGLKAAVLAIVTEAVIRIGRRALGNKVRLGVAAAAFLGIFLLDLPFPLIVLAAGLVGFAASRMGSTAFAAGGGHGSFANPLPDAESALGTAMPAHALKTGRGLFRLALALLALWLAPVLLLAAAGPATFADIAFFFSKMAVVTFGGAYAVLAYVAQAAVETYGWLAPGEMLDGLGLAETTPGPLIMVTQFVGFLGAYRDPGAMPPLLAGTLGGLLTTWVTFVPCFLWIFVCAPYVERLRQNRALAAALAAVTAAVVGRDPQPLLVVRAALSVRRAAGSAAGAARARCSRLEQCRSAGLAAFGRRSHRHHAVQGAGAAGDRRLRRRRAGAAGYPLTEL
jgi:chromate transporter